MMIREKPILTRSFAPDLDARVAREPQDGGGLHLPEGVELGRRGTGEGAVWVACVSRPSLKAHR